ncbi:alpha/beta hydrolase [Amycolatopsis oliviviridis]|nr:alpha/beta hydrolase [Amycolatopsis oliviviridis]
MSGQRGQWSHRSRSSTKNMCANDTVTAFLATGERPERDRACAAES